jgi:hypothetical protein
MMGEGYLSTGDIEASWVSMQEPWTAFFVASAVQTVR